MRRLILDIITGVIIGFGVATLIVVGFSIYSVAYMSQQIDSQ